MWTWQGGGRVFFQMLMDMNPQIFAMNISVIPKFRQYGYQAVKHWTKIVDLFQYSKLFFPMNLGGVHWAMVVVDLQKKAVLFYDSMHYYPAIPYTRVTLKYLKNVYMDKKKQDFDISMFSSENVRSTPKQLDFYNCGVFMLKYAENIARNQEIKFTDENISFLRRCIVYEVSNNEFLHKY